MLYFNKESGRYESDKLLVRCHVCDTPVGDVYDGRDPDTVAQIASGDLSPICDDCQDKEFAAEGNCRNCGNDQPPREVVGMHLESPYCADCVAQSEATRA